MHSLCFKNYLIVNSCESHAKLLFLPRKISRDIQLKLASHPDLKNNPSASAPKTDKYWNNFFFFNFLFFVLLSLKISGLRLYLQASWPLFSQQKPAKTQFALIP